MAAADVVPLGDYFSDADDGESATLMYKLVDSSDSSNPEKNSITYRPSSTAVLTATITAADPSATPPTVATLTLTGLATISTNVPITVRATDAAGNSVDGTFNATVTNTLPKVVGSGIDDQRLVIGETAQLTLTTYFTDTETSDANLTFSASSSDTAVVKTPTVNSTSKVMTLEVPGGATDKATAIITVTATDESGKSLAQTFTATTASRPAFASATPTATLAENANGSVAGAPVVVTNLPVTGSTDKKLYLLVSVDGRNRGADFGKFAVTANTDAPATMAEVTYKGTGEDYEATSGVPTFELVISMIDSNTLLAAAVNTTLTVTVANVNDAPTYVSASQTPSSPKLLERRPSNDADTTPATNDDALPLATLTFADQDGDSLTYSVASVASVVPAHSSSSVLAASDFLFTQTSTNPPKAHLSFVGDGSKIVYGTAAGEVQSFTATVRATDGDGAQVDQDVTITVQENVAPTVTVAATGSPSLQPNSSLTLAATATDANTAAGDVLSYLWSVASATGTGATTGDITFGTRTAASTSLTVPAKPAGTKYVIQMTVTDLVNNSVTADYSLFVASAGAATVAAIPALSFPAQSAIDTETLPAGSGGTGALTYSLAAVVASESTTAGMLVGNPLLPQGLVFDATPANRALTGEPTAAAVGVYDMTYTVTDSVDEVAMKSFKLTVTANEAPVFSDAAKAMVEASYSEAASTAIADLVLPAATGGEGDLVYSLTATSDSSTTANIVGGWPAGLVFTASSRTLAGTPTAVDNYSLTYEANDTDSNSASSDTATITFKMVVAADVVPTLTPSAAITRTGYNGLALTTITLPVAGAGNFDLTDSLSGKHAPAGGSATAVTVPANGGVIKLTDAATTATGLTFTPMGASAATITGTPEVNGVFTLTYKVVDSDNNKDDCTGVGTPAGCDTAEVLVTLTVVYPAAAKIKDIADIASLARSTSSTPSTTTVNLYEYFSPTGGLTFAVDSSNEKVLTVAETGGVLTLTATQAGGTSTVMVTASNDTPPTTPRSTTFAVTVTPTTAPVFSRRHRCRQHRDQVEQGPDRGLR